MKSIAIIIPFFNEAERFTVEEYETSFAPYSELTFLLVNDGSSDGTGHLLNKLALKLSNVQVLHLEKNQGKAEAVRKGSLKLLDQGKFEFIGYFDADLATPLSQLTLFREAMQNPGNQLWFGSRIKRAGAEILRNPTRHYSGRVIATIVNIFILKIPIYDTQCGAKILTRKIASEVFENPFISRWFFDIEIVARLQQVYSRQELKKMIFEIPLTKWTEKGSTKIRVKDILLIPLHLIKIRMKYS
ncbi:glycosyltransferase [Salinimicrobium oceani]|uniref:Glycosyltransferase n=1 Tax=Salinimicrobium oceani TaxID=2722702 RepID=A0ABX1D300_9FLAO|nr:glycosyltransferase [Salinimicrobium oceani]NJW54044.1 glycosyltransferase [Salinimicrobium oceani]